MKSVIVSPSCANVPTGQTHQFDVIGRDQFGNPLSPQPSFTWTVSGGGTISAFGLYAAGTSKGGPYTIMATSGSVSGMASVIITSSTTPDYQINCGSNNAVSPFASDQYGIGGTMATVREFTVTANGFGQIVINFNTITNNATIGGIEIISN